MSDEIKTKHGAESMLRLHSIMTLAAARAYLDEVVRDHVQHPLYKALAFDVLRDDQFYRCPAAKGKHQAYPGGLAIHTAQMLQTALAMLTTVPDARIEETIVAGIWHDFGKLYDYVEVDTPGAPPYDYTDHKELVGHLTRSYAEFFRAANFMLKPDEELDDDVDLDFVGHLILAHHGRLEWGSPVVPKCAEAWALHCGDMLSSQFVKDA